jgi:iron complex transport system substrate-binding protein
MRLVSLVPSITETLCAFGLEGSVAGCTSFCTHPLSLRRTATSVGGTKDARLESILSLAPTHVFANTEENKPELIDALREEGRARGFVTHVSFPRTVDESIRLVEELGDLLGFRTAAGAWSAACAKEREGLADLTANAACVPYAYFIWRDPWMVAGDKTYIARMLAEGGLVNAIVTGESMVERYPAVDPAAPVFRDPELRLLFSSEPFPFKTRHMAEFEGLVGRAEREGVPREPEEPEILLPVPLSMHKVDGRLLSWYGYSTLPGLQYVAALRRRIDQ